MKQKKWKIGTRCVKPFPVANLRFRPIAGVDPCTSRVCQSLKFLPEPAKGAFAVQSCMDETVMDKDTFTGKEIGEILWEKAYREQLAGKEPESLAYPVCAQCTAFVIMQFLNHQDEQGVMFMMATAITRGLTIILFDRNLSRNQTDPSCVVGAFETLADFRNQYWKEIGPEK